MPKNSVSDPITDQEMAFARLVLSGTMTDQRAAQAAGLNPGTAAYTKSKPGVRAYMLEHRAAVEQQLIEQEAQALQRLNLGREQVLARLWEIANLSPEMTRGSITGQVKALSMIVAIEGLIPDRRAGSAGKKSDPPPTQPQFYKAAWLRQQEGETIDSEPGPELAQEEEDLAVAQPDPEPGSAADAPPTSGPDLDPSEFAFASRFTPSETIPPPPHEPVFVSAPDTRVPFSIKKNRFGPCR